MQAKRKGKRGVILAAVNAYGALDAAIWDLCTEHALTKGTLRNQDTAERARQHLDSVMRTLFGAEVFNKKTRDLDSLEKVVAR